MATYANLTSHDAIFCHSCLNMNKQLNWNVLAVAVYNHMLTIHSILSVLSNYLNIIQIFNYLYKTTLKKYSIFKCTVGRSVVYTWAQNLRQGIVMKPSFKSRVSQMGLGSFVNFNIFVMKYYFLSLFTFSILFEFVKSKSTEMLRPQKGNSGVSFKDFLLNFGLWGKLLNLILFLSLWSFPKRMRLQRRLYRMSWPFFFLQRRLYSMSSVVLSSEM